MKALCALGAAVAIGYCPAAFGDVVTIDFEDFTPGSVQTMNQYQDGFLFSPDCHIDVLNVEPWDPVGSGRWMGFDVSGCGTIYNDNYLGPTEPSRGGRVFVAREDGRTFDLLSLDLMFTGWQLTSSAGGYYFAGRTAEGFPTAVFSGAEWTGLSWMIFQRESGGPGGLDNLTVRVGTAVVPSAPTLALCGAALLGLIFASGRTRKLTAAKPTIWVRGLREIERGDLS